ncbi:hypothetical protein BN189_1350002 [Clostridioides difficile T10]|nr:hypothetical protein BN181_1510002 [Clostridioides difficile T17]CCL82759.1 hypothetical protein BN188_1010071 [Clostridioides difficile T19]CCL86757.1 hypothetical protein BN189_1350002 [Clostridioides difficile T10]
MEFIINRVYFLDLNINLNSTRKSLFVREWLFAFLNSLLIK